MRYIFIFILFFVWGCDPCRECGTVAFEPTMTLRFINQDSLNALNPEVEKLTDSVEKYDSTSFSNDTLITRLRADSVAIRMRINSGEVGLESKIMELSDAITDAREIIIQADTSKDFYDSILANINGIISTIQSGNVKVDRIFNNTIERAVPVEEDSTTAFSVPLSYGDTTIQYEIALADFLGTVTFKTRLDTITDVRRNILIKTDTIFIFSFRGFLGYDTCKLNCNDGQAVFTLYF